MLVARSVGTSRRLDLDPYSSFVLVGAANNGRALLLNTYPPRYPDSTPGETIVYRCSGVREENVTEKAVEFSGEENRGQDQCPRPRGSAP